MLERIPQISPAEWLAWKKDPVTQEILATLIGEREYWADKLIKGETLIPGREVAETATAVGAILGLDYLLEGVEELLKSKWEEETA